jgi:hypothetical protein
VLLRLLGATRESGEGSLNSGGRIRLIHISSFPNGVKMHLGKEHSEEVVPAVHIVPNRSIHKIHCVQPAGD